MRVGTAEDIVKQPTLVGAKAEMDRLRLAGFDSVRVTQQWARGQRAPSATDLNALRNVVAAARLDAMQVIVAVYPFGSSQTPLTEEARSEFVAYTTAIARALPSVRHYIIGNEPNLNRFWLPQFNPDGSNAAAPAFLPLLARSYDALKAVSPAITVIGVAVSPRGSDNVALPRHTHSPTKFLRDLGAAYRASGRTRPIMDWLAIHPYQDNSSQPPTTGHPTTTTITIADYEKLVRMLGEAFDGTAQRGSTLPILYAEFGVQATIPARKAALYTGREAETTRPVDEPTHGRYYRQAIELAFCQPNVRGIFVLHSVDEPALDRWQSGVFYADGSPKSSVGAVRAAASASRRGIVASCPGMQLRVRARVTAVASRGGPIRARVECDIDCVFAVRLERLPRAALAGKIARGVAVGRRPRTITVSNARLAPGRFRLKAIFLARLNRGPRTVTTTQPFEVARPAQEEPSP